MVNRTTYALTGIRLHVYKSTISLVSLQLDSVMGIVDKRDPLDTRGQGLGCWIDVVEFTSVF